MDTDKEEMRLRKANNNTYCDLVLACHADIGYDLVDEAVTTNLPEGDANLAWNKLKERFDPQDTADKFRLKGKFTRSKLSAWKENPEDSIMRLKIKRTKLKRINHIISDKDLMINILNNLPEEYESKIEQVKKEMEDTVKIV